MLYFQQGLQMENLEVEFYSLFKMDVELGSPVQINFAGETKDLQNYAELLLSEIFAAENSRQHLFKNDKELVLSRLLEIAQDNKSYERNSEEIALKLHEVEVDRQNDLRHLTKFKKGGLIQLKITHDNQSKYIIVKIDNNEYFDFEDLTIKGGLPTEKSRMQKVAVITFDVEGSVSELLLSDSKKPITEYWYKYFLIADPIQDSELNTNNAFKVIESKISEVRRISQTDYWYLRNELISYFRNSIVFSFDELVKKLSEHRCVSEEFIGKFDKFIEDVKKLPKKFKGTRNQFDTQFDIVNKCIDARMMKKIILDDNFELRIKGEVKNLESKLIPDIDEGGKYIKIYSDLGYDEFKK
jgi:hypothetical protein